MTTRRTVDLLPEIFRTDTNRKFLSATLDQLTQEPRFTRTRGYVGRRIGPGVNPKDNYVRESTAQRADYQLEPGVAFLRPDTNQVQDAITYPGMIDTLQVLGADTARQDRLFQSDYYTWDSFCDLDKFTNYSQYYWLPGGPEAVDVGRSQVPLTDDFVVTRNNISYSFSGVAGTNPVITLARGGNYEFQVNQPGHGFWIQSAPGVNGRLPTTPNISSRDVLGVSNNGAATGTVTFDVPLRTAQDFYYNLVEIDPVDLVSEFRFDQLNNRYVDQFLAENPSGIDGITNLDSRTVIFINQETDPVLGGWQIQSLFDPLPPGPGSIGQPGSFDSLPYSDTQYIISQGARYGIWRINYVPAGPGRSIMRLSLVQQVPVFNRFRIRFGAQYSSTNWFKNTQEFFERIPLLTAIQDTLWYQDSTNPEIFGVIRLVDPQGPQLIDIEEIIGARDYVSPNGVVFTNGLKVQFRGPTNPPQFQDLEYYVEGVGTGPGRDLRVGFVDGEAYFGPFHVHQGQRMTGSTHTGVAHQFIWETLAESLANLGAAAPPDAPLPRRGVPGVTEGNGIRLVPVRELVTPETYTGGLLTPYDSTSYDATPFDETLNAPLVKDYITMNRASRDRNAWSRSNRWFHVDVIRYSAQLNNSTPVIDNRSRGSRPIIEFRANLRLFDFGTQAKLPVNIVDFSATDALSDVNGSIGYSVDGYRFLQGTRVIFAADLDKDVRNRVYVVNFIDPDGVEATAPVIHLVPDPDGEALVDQTVVSLNGITQQGRSFWFDGASWKLAQQKTGVNQALLFDVYDAQGRSFGDRAFYPSTTFAGNRLFGYAVGGTQITDRELGFALKYLNINNVGDIVFQNYFYTDRFRYVQDRQGVEAEVGTGFVRQYRDRVDFSQLIGWLPAATQNRSRQTFRFTNSTGPLILDIPVDTSSQLPPVQLFLDGVFVDPGRYEVVVQGSNTFITPGFAVPPDSVIEVSVLSDQPSSVGFYQVPVNLENNALNQNSAEFTLGAIRTHYETIGQNLRALQGPIVGANNTRDLGDISRYGQNIIQNSSPLTLAGVFLREPQYDIAQSIRFNSQEYEKYKARLLQAASQGDFVNATPTQILDACLQEISITGQESGPFYWSDMIPAGETYTESRTVYSFISTPTFDINRVYDFSTSNFQSLLIYVNGGILTRGRDYEVGDGTPTVTITRPLAVGNVIVIREYATTFGSFVPNTPTKMGLYPAFLPEIYVDTSYVTPQTVIRGHDGSITLAYGDARDQVLLEFETRIYNNLKVPGLVPLVVADVTPGQWRETGYDLAEINGILSTDFLSWIGWNKIDYTTQLYDANNAFTFNYSQSSDRISGDVLLGAWRGIYQYFYDTTAPDSSPWEMLGFSQQPAWWESRYGPAPYTSGNLVLWEDLAQGIVRDPRGEYIDPRYRRPGLLQAIPVGSEGELLPPSLSVMGDTDALSYQRSWTFGDGGPAESAWRTSSSWPFAVMRLLVLTKPAQFFSLFADRDRYRFDTTTAQFLWDQRSRLDAEKMAPLYGSGQSRASYINWIIDRARQLGVDSTRDLEIRLQNLDLRLCWRLGAFSDKRFLKIFTERSTPTSLNASLLLPDESYQILLYQNPAFASFQYSSMIVQQVPGGWTVFGYSTTQPYFNILASRPYGVSRTITAGEASVQVATQHSDVVVRVPYGYVFRNRAALCDFIISYGKLLERQGISFEGMENGYVMDWQQMAQEFLYWSTQGWIDGSMINLNPAATRISITRPGAVAQSLVPVTPDNVILNQNRQAISPDSVVINRLNNTISFEVTGPGNDTINYFGLRFTAYEHLVVLDNRSIFADLIYDPVTGARQSRVLVAGILSADWDGTVNAPGFVLNQDNIRSWNPNQIYTKGEIVRFKDELWTASTIIQPSEEFDYTVWLRSDYDEIQQGLLPNAATASDQLAEAYSVYRANLEREVDLFSYGLIGFRPRQYMADLDLDDVSQVNLYQQFLGSKGTRGSLEIFSQADLGKESAEYDVYEYWSIRRGLYGATANRSYVELLLDPSRLTSDPSIIDIVQPGQTSQADQSVLIRDIWKSSYTVTGTDILPTIKEIPTDRALPGAGYVNFDDVDIAVFDLDSLLDQDIDRIEAGTTVWTAADSAYDWNVYRARTTPGRVIRVSDNLDSSSSVTFSSAHGLSRGDIVVIRFFSPDINGAYRILSVPSIFTVTIDYSFPGSQTSIEGQGVALELATARIRQASDLAMIPGSAELDAGNRIWVDQSPLGQWTVLEKTQPFSRGEDLLPELTGSGAGAGTAVAQGFSNLSALVGAPDYNPGALVASPGAVVAYVRDFQDQYLRNDVLLLPVTDVAGYGNALDIGDQEWAVSGASASNSQQGYAATIFRPLSSSVFQIRQLLTAGDLEYSAIRFGDAVAISRDERWIGIGAPGDAMSQPGGACYIYARQDVQPQSVAYITDGVTTIYNYADHVVVTDASTVGPDPAWQFTVSLEGNILQPGTDYVTDVGFVILLAAPAAGQTLRITRRVAARLDQQQYLDVPAQTQTGVGSGTRFNVTVTRGSYQPQIAAPGLDYSPGDQLLIPGTALGGSSPANDLILTVTAVINTAIADFAVTSGSGLGNTTVFSLDRLFAQVDDIWDFVVIVNGDFQRPYQDYDYVNGDLVFSAVPPVGAIIDVTADTHFTYVGKITAPAGLGAGSRFGTSVTTTTDGKAWAVGAPGTDGTGLTVIYSRDSEKFLVEVSGPQSFDTVESLIAPTMVKVNGQFLLDTELNIGGEFTVTSSNSVEITRSLQIGDVVEIYTNQFQETQVLASQEPAAGMEFGAQVTQCVNDCSLYVAAPGDSRVLPQAGSVDLWQNQTRLYGSITSQIANPVLTPGGIIYINGYLVAVTGASIDDLLDDINEANIPNATAVPTPDLTLRGDGSTTEFAVGDIYSSTQFVGAPNTVVRVDGVTQTPGTDYTYDDQDRSITFMTAPETDSDITVVSGRIMIMARRPEVAPPFSRLTLYPGAGTLWQDLGLDLYVWQQTIQSPVPQDFGRFGSSISISDDTSTLVVGAPDASTIADVTFDQGSTVFDGTATGIADAIDQSGAVYVYDFLPAYQPSVSNPGQFVFGQQIQPRDLQPLSRFGAAVNITTGTLLSGAPSALDNGVVFQDINRSRLPIWSVARAESAQVNINLLNTSYIYNIADPAPATYLDYFDPLQGRMLGAITQNIDYVGAIDPASYNVGPVNNRGNRWAQDHVGRIWWDTTRVRFVDANQGDVTYSSRRWGQVFPGSSVEIFQWIASDVAPAQYTGPGTPRDVASYVLTPTVDAQGVFRDIYYFWVSGLTTVDRSRGKTLSTDTLVRYIQDPRTSGIPYLAPLSTNTVALYNCRDAIVQVNSVLHVEFDRVQNDAAVHVENQLIAQGRADAFLDAALYRKLLDSFCGVDIIGAAVPDPTLSPGERYGVSVRPRQSMFVDRFAALENYLTSANTVLAMFPISETRGSRLLDSAEPEPSANSPSPGDRWDMRVLDDQELSFQDLAEVPLGYRYLVSVDARNQGLWTIYEVQAGDLAGSRKLQLRRVQSYDTRKYWRRIDWYQPGYDPLTRVLLEVPRSADLLALQVPAGSSVKVTANSRGKWEIYRLTGDTWIRVALESGTIEFDARLWDYQLGRFGFDSEVFDSQYFDQEPVTETRRILEAINQELLIDDLLIERNRLLILMFNYILSEQISPDWLTKTSLIDVDHTIRNLQPFQIYRQDNQDFVLQYINEVKPYHVQIREFGLIYRGLDTYQGSVTDFDLPATWDPNQRLFVSPVLDDTGTLSTTSSAPSDAPIWQEFPWDQWYQNYLLGVRSVQVVDGGSGYTVPPQVEVSGTSARPAQMTARINSEGRVVAVDVIDPGEAYSTDAVVTLTGGNGVGARAVVIMGNTKIRSIVTRIRYDRYQYSSSIEPWQPGRVYAPGDRVRYRDRAWQALVPQASSTQDFDPDQWRVIPAGDLAAADRVMGYYAPGPNQPGVELAQLISGIDYPGVQVAAPDFNQNTGFDVGNFDINPFDNISIGPEGLPTYDPAILDAIYESEFTDPFLGVLPAPAYAGDPPTTGPNPITVDGGAFVDTYSSHAPPELVPGAVFDTLDLRVLTTPGADWPGQGRGFPISSRRYQFDPAVPVLDYSGLLDSASYLSVFNATTGTQLTPDVDYTVAWSQYEIFIASGASAGDVLAVSLAALGGGNQIFARTYLGSDIGFSLIIPVRASDVADVVIFANDRSITNFSYEPLGASSIRLLFSQQFFTTDVVNITVLGNVPPVISWSMPRTQYIVAGGSQNYVLDNSVAGANPPNAVVTVDGERVRPYAGRRYISDGVSSVFDLPEISDVSPNTIAVNDVSVFVSDVALTLGVDFTVDPWDGINPRTVTLAVAPVPGSRVLITVRTGARYRIVSDVLVFLPSAGAVPAPGSIIGVTTFNDLRGQAALTTVQVGAVPDDTYAVGQPVSRRDRLVVTVDGTFLFSGLDYELVDDAVVLSPGSVGAGTVVAITSFTDDVIPQAQSFRVFQDMRGRQLLYRILPSNSTEITQALSATDDTIFVRDAARLDESNLAQGIFGILTINGERITYRARDLINNTITGLRRGTAGTGAATHALGSAVLGMGSSNLLPAEYQRKVLKEDFLGDGTQTVFVAASLSIDDADSTLLTEAVQVFVAGSLQASGYAVDSVNPVQITFGAAPTAGYQVSIEIQQARVMYQQGIGTASDGVPLQETDTSAAKFIRGQ